MQVLNAEEFDESSKILSGYATLVHDHIIHDRRNRVYKFESPLEIGVIEIQSIEIFEPKPNADANTLKPGIEHMAFKVNEYDIFFEWFKQQGHPIDKSSDMDGSKFFKTKLVDMVEIEFRNDFLGTFDT